MKLSRFLECMEQIAPASLAWERDNVGLLIGTRKTEIRKVLVALDCTQAVAQEAAQWGADLVLTHHPLFFQPIQRIDPFSAQTAAAYTLIEHGIGMFAAHTNLDAAEGGVNDVLCEKLGLKHVHRTDADPLIRLGSVEPMETLSAFGQRCARILGANCDICGDADKPVHKVAVIGGSGGSEWSLAYTLGADTLVTGEAKHHDALNAYELGMSVVVLGHYQTEIVVLESVISRLQREDFDVQYRISRTERAFFARLEGGSHE